MSTSIIKKSVHFVFIPVRDMEKAVEFYSKLLDLPTHPKPYGTLYNLPMKSPNIVLDSNQKDFTASSHPLFSFFAPDIVAAQTFIKKLDVEVGELNYFSDVSFFEFKDHHGNIITVVSNTDIS